MIVSNCHRYLSPCPSPLVAPGAAAAGYACPSGSTNATAVLCTPGRYSLGGASACTLCSGGLYGDSYGLASSSCSGMCTAGYACPDGSSSPTVTACAVGTYSVSGSPSCSLCPAGYFGNATTLTTSTCSGLCAAGYSCPAGSTMPNVTLCPVGQYSQAGAAVSRVPLVSRWICYVRLVASHWHGCVSHSPLSRPTSLHTLYCSSLSEHGLLLTRRVNTHVCARHV